MTRTTMTTNMSAIHRFEAAVGIALVLSLGRPPVAVGQDLNQSTPAADIPRREFVVDTDHTTAGVIIAWNDLAHDIAVAEDQFRTFKGQRALAMMHLAMHDALNSIVPLYQRYAYAGSRLAAHPVAAAAQGAHDVLVSQYPDQRSRLTAELSRWLDTVPSGTRREQAIELGRAAAAAILNVRANDRFDFPGTYEFRDGAGQYQTTPPWSGFVAQPGFRVATPFTLDFPGQYRPPPPPPLNSRIYAKAFDEVKEYGSVDSRVRTEDQTAYAIWWMEFAEGSVNRLARQLAAERNMQLWAAARLFAHIGMALFDTYVLCGIPNTTTTTGAPTPPSERLAPTATPARHQIAPGSRCARRRHFPSTCRRMQPPARPRSGSSRRP